MFKIKAPVKGYTGTGYGLTFVNGLAETENASTARRLAAKGYTVEEVGDVAEKDKRAENMTVEELRAYAGENGIDLKGVTKKADILALIKSCPTNSAPSADAGAEGAKEGEG